ncbi:TECR reductase, partial [Polypterus senegalus]
MCLLPPNPRLGPPCWDRRSPTTRRAGGTGQAGRRGLCGNMDINSVALEASQPPKKAANGMAAPVAQKRPSKPKKAKKAVVFFEVEILDAKTKEKLCFLDKSTPPYSPPVPAHLVSAYLTQCMASDLREGDQCEYPPTHQESSSPEVQCMTPSCHVMSPGPLYHRHVGEVEGKSLKDEDILQNLPVGTTATLYFRDLGAQISWVTVFLTEYAGPLLIYLMFYFRVPFIYSPKYDFTTSKHWVVHLACMCHSFHYVKRLLETLFVHRFSHGTMPLRNIFKIGNFSIHIALRNLRPPGSKTRKIPYPTKNPFTWLFLLVSCPNYTYEVGSWVGFTVMTQCLPVAFFTLVGFIQMTIWAKGKHRSYLKEFRDYPPLRSPILPFML